MQRGSVQEVELCLNHALEFYRQAHSVPGEANSLQNLGDVYLRQDNLHDAELCLNNALLLHRQFQVPSNEAKSVSYWEYVQCSR
jgi:tetratricopeptide (TPR) repeat protein